MLSGGKTNGVRAFLILLGIGFANFYALAAHAQVIVADTNVGYIDSAIPATQVRFRFDAAYSTPFPDRVEFQYAKYNNPGPPLSETEINSHQEFATYFEYSPGGRFSIFAELPVRWINPELNDNTSGLYDMNAGAKLAIYENDFAVVALQFRTYMATGDTDRGLSTGHASLEPAILGLVRLTERLTLEGEVRDWIPIDASNTGAGGAGGGGGGGGGGMGQGGNREFSGNVLRFGLGLGYTIVEEETYLVRPVAECVGWHTLGGLKSTPDGQRIPASDETIVDLKFGLRGILHDGDGLTESTSLFLGYGRALTDAAWYDDIVRMELRCTF